jgi:hypothetical protein
MGDAEFEGGGSVDWKVTNSNTIKILWGPDAASFTPGTTQAK